MSEQAAVRSNGAHIEVQNLTMAYGDFLIQKDLSFTVSRGEIFVIMGGVVAARALSFDTSSASLHPPRGTSCIKA